ncbi:MAG: hypothetical protein E7121_06515 [Bacteroidales bacterium]|nr:hypothetical protein [Bacteroidales bacterium]
MGKEILLLLVMFWNLENFFDPFEGNSHGRSRTDADTARYEIPVEEPFTPNGEKFWTWKKFSRKRDDIARTVALVKERYGLFPAIIGLCEVENRFVLQQLTQNTILAKLDYGIVHRDSPDKRGIDAALLYRKGIFKPLKVEYYPVNMEKTDRVGAQILHTREIVHVKGVLHNLDTLHCLVVHWPSKLGGERESFGRRRAASERLRHVTDSILSDNQKANIIVMGDFNDSPGSPSLANIDNMVNMSEKERLGVPRKIVAGEPHRWYTYKYKESWERIDHFLISDHLWRDSGSGGSGEPELKWIFCTNGSSSVFSHNFLLEEDKLYLGYKIRRSLSGPRYKGGVSDHLPIVLKVWGYEY